jgi:hypothetical protein
MNALNGESGALDLDLLGNDGREMFIRQQPQH